MSKKTDKNIRLKNDILNIIKYIFSFMQIRLQFLSILPILFGDVYINGIKFIRLTDINWEIQ